VIETSLATEIAVPPGKMRTCKPSTESAAYFGITEMAAAEMAAAKSTTKMATAKAATKMAPTKTATVTAATKTAPVTTATAPMRKRVDSQSAGESGSRSQDDHGLA
jgi:hypothetical protein